MDTTHDSTTITYTVLASNMLSAVLTLAASVPRPLHARSRRRAECVF